MKMFQSLKSAKIYYENGDPFMKLVYTYDDEDGGHEITFPKVEFPFPTQNIPSINHHGPFNATIDVSSIKNLFCKDEVYYTDKLVNPMPREMTMEEIEKTLGYPVKIVSERKENKDD